MIRIVSLVKDTMGMKYVNVYKSPDTGWTTFDTMSYRGYRVFVHLTPGESVEKPRQELMMKAAIRAVDFQHLELQYRVIATAMAAASANSYGFMLPENIEPDVIRGRWGLAMFWARNPWLKIPMNWYSPGDVELALRQHFGV